MFDWETSCPETYADDKTRFGLLAFYSFFAANDDADSAAASAALSSQAQCAVSS